MLNFKIIQEAIDALQFRLSMGQTYKNFKEFEEVEIEALGDRYKLTVLYSEHHTLSLSEFSSLFEEFEGVEMTFQEGVEFTTDAVVLTFPIEALASPRWSY